MAAAPGSNFAPMGLGGPGTAPNYRAPTAQLPGGIQLPGVTSGRAPWLPQGTALPELTLSPSSAGSESGMPWHVQLSQDQRTRGQAAQAEMEKQKQQAALLKQQSDEQAKLRSMQMLSQAEVDPWKWGQAEEEVAMMRKTDPNLSGQDENELIRAIYRSLGGRTDSGDGGDDGGDGGDGGGGEE